MLYTSSYFTLPKDLDCFKVQISNSKPKDFEVDTKFSALIPNWGYVEEYKRTGDKDTFIKRYKKQLSKYDAKNLKEELEKISKNLGKPIVFLCWETKNFCHRSILGEFINIKELK